MIIDRCLVCNHQLTEPEDSASICGVCLEAGNYVIRSGIDAEKHQDMDPTAPAAFWEKDYER